MIKKHALDEEGNFINDFRQIPDIAEVGELRDFSCKFLNGGLQGATRPSGSLENWAHGFVSSFMVDIASIA